MSEPVFLTVDEVLRIHTRSLTERGGGEGIRDPELVESALAMIEIAKKNLTKADLAAIFRKAATT